MTGLLRIDLGLKTLLKWGVASGLLLSATVDASGDQISIRGGGQIKGKVLSDAAHPDRVSVITENGKVPLSFQKKQIVNVVREPSPLDDYVAKRKKVGDSADAQYELGAWCEEHKLADLATLHFENALKKDPNHGQAHQKLGHVQSGDRWLTGDDVLQAQGLVKYKGKWVTPEERENREAQVATSAEQASWVRRIRLLRQAIVGGASDRAREAEQQLMEIREPIAVKPLVKVLGEDSTQLRTLLSHVLGVIPGPESAAALVHRILGEAESDVRHVTLSELERRSENNVIPMLIRALGSSNPEVVNRAAWTLSNLDAVKTVPHLVPALITTEYRMVMDNSGGGGGSGPGFGSVNPGIPYGAPIYTNGSSLGILTPPVVGPGVVAYGATQVPWVNAAPSLAMGGGLLGSRGPIPRIMSYSYQNVEVLGALVKLTGQDFGYDIPAWQRWLRTEFQPEREPARKVNQP